MIWLSVATRFRVLPGATYSESLATAILSDQLFLHRLLHSACQIVLPTFALRPLPERSELASRRLIGARPYSYWRLWAEGLVETRLRRRGVPFQPVPW